jgi:hypothetical protein
VTSANTPTSIAIDVDALTNGYYRVFVANSQGVLSAPATNSVTISVSRASTVVALNCATGGAHAVGAIGPGGGTVFYCSETAFTSTGSDCGTNCHYLEAAPSDSLTTINWATTAAACYDSVNNTSSNNCRNYTIYSGDSTAQAASRTAAEGIGMGMANTNQVYARLTTVGTAATSSYAAGIAWEYANNSKTDWFLPSKNELNQMCRYAWNLTVNITDTTCTGLSGTIRSDFSTNNYSSSSENSATNNWRQSFFNGTTTSNGKSFLFFVRPVRAF